MRTEHRSLCYQDFWETIETGAIKLTPENACCVTFFRFSPSWNDQTTAIMDAFCSDKKTFMLIRYGDYDTTRLWLVAQYEPHRTAPKSAPTITNIKEATRRCPSFYVCKEDGLLRTTTTNRLKPIAVSILDSLPKPSAPGLYKIKNPQLFQAQIPEDRLGFYKNNIRGQIISEKPYGYCSMVLSVVAVYLN